MSVVSSVSVAPSFVCVGGNPSSFSPGEFRRLLDRGYVFPENTVVTGDLDFRNRSEEIRLPLGLQVQGKLDFSCCTGLIALPKGLQVGGDLWFLGCTSLTKLPEGLRVRYNLNLSLCKGLIALPEDLQVGGNLYLANCAGLTSVPKTLRIQGDLDFSDCVSLTSLPEGLQVGGDLDLSRCTGLTALPKGLQVGGALNLRSCTGLISLSGDLQVQGSLSFGQCTGLMALPEDLQVQGDLDLSDCTGLTSLPEWIAILRPRADEFRRDVNLERTGLSAAILERLRGITLPGVWFTISFPPSIPTTQSLDFKAAADFWLEVGGDATQVVRAIALGADEEPTLLNFLARLTTTEEYQNLTTRRVLGSRIMDVLDAMAKHGGIRDQAIACMVAYTDTCDDAVIVGLDRIEQMIYMHEISRGLPTEETVKSAGRKFFFLERIRVQAAAFAETLIWKDPIETVLAVEIGLAERFGLPMQTRNMIFRHCAQITDAQIQRIGDVVAEECTDKAFEVFFQNWHPWIEYQRHSYIFPEYKDLETANVEEVVWNDRCPILQDVSLQPILYDNRHVFDYESFKKSYLENGMNPVTGLPIDPKLVKRKGQLNNA